MRLKKRAESALVLIYTEGAEVLLLERADWPGFWQSVTGSLEADELPFEAAKRELFEETGLKANEGTFTDRQCSDWFDIYPEYLSRYESGVTKNHEHVFTFCVSEPCPIQMMKNEHSAYQWVAKEQAVEMALSWTNKKAIERWVPSVGS